LVRANPSMPRSCTLVLTWGVVSGKRIPSYGVVNRDYLNALRRGRQWNRQEVDDQPARVLAVSCCQRPAEQVNRLIATCDGEVLRAGVIARFSCSFGLELGPSSESAAVPFVVALIARPDARTSSAPLPCCGWGLLSENHPSPLATLASREKASASPAELRKAMKPSESLHGFPDIAGWSVYPSMAAMPGNSPTDRASAQITKARPCG
jgi:hypothetical protein